jgi:hypothetical protein
MPHAPSRAVEIRTASVIDKHTGWHIKNKTQTDYRKIMDIFSVLGFVT